MCFCVCLLWVRLARLALIETLCYSVGTLANLLHIFLLCYFCLSSQTYYLSFPICQIFSRKDISESLLAINMSVNYALYYLASLTFLVTFHLINRRPCFFVGSFVCFSFCDTSLCRISPVSWNNTWTKGSSPQLSLSFPGSSSTRLTDLLLNPSSHAHQSFTPVLLLG